jgi:hypothetical protein
MLLLRLLLLKMMLSLWLVSSHPRRRPTPTQVVQLPRAILLALLLYHHGAYPFLNTVDCVCLLLRVVGNEPVQLAESTERSRSRAAAAAFGARDSEDARAWGQHYTAAEKVVRSTAIGIA